MDDLSPCLRITDRSKPERMGEPRSAHRQVC
jgi:hypothetical protein